MNLIIDLAALALVALAAHRGWRLGASAVAARLAGLLAGVVVGLMLAAQFVSSRLSPVAHLLLGLLIVLGSAVIGAKVGSTLASVLLHRVDGPARTLDRIAGTALRGGLAAGVVSIALVSFASLAPPQWARAARGSAVAAALAPTGTALRHVGSKALQVAPDDIAALVPSVSPNPPTRAAAARVAAKVGDSVVEVFSTNCGTGVQGTGFAVGNGDLVVTNAHVVRSSDDVQIKAPGHPSKRATVIAFAPGPDLAVLAVDGLGSTPLTVAGSDAANGSQAVVIGYPAGARTTTPAAVLERLPLLDPDWSGNLALHLAYLIDAPVRHGNSGSPLLDMRGRVIGVVNALSTTDTDGGYATAGAELRRVLIESAGHTSPVSTGTCAPQEGTS